MAEKWSPEEIDLLKELYPRIWVKDLALRFPKRNKATLVAKARDLGLPSAKLWRISENKILQKYFQLSPYQEIVSLLPGRSWTAIMAQAERLGVKRKRDRPRLEINENYFNKWSPNMAYILGYILADGCIIQGTYKGYSDSLKFGVQLNDLDILEKIKYELVSQHKISKVKKAFHLSISSQKIVDSLKKLGILYRKSLNEQIPTVPKRYIRDFIRGIVDGDGSIWLDHRNYPTLSVAGGRKTLEFIRNYFLKKFKIYSVLSIQSYSKDCKAYLYQIAYRCNSAQTLLRHLYQNSYLYLDRKYSLAIRCLGINIRTKHNYLKDEEILIKKYYKTLSRHEIKQYLPNRNWQSIQSKASRLNIHKYNINRNS